MYRGLQTLLALTGAALFLSACGGDDTPDTDGGLTAKELAAKLPDGGKAQAVAVDVDAAREAAGLPEGTDPTEVSTSREELRFGLSTFTSLLSLSALTDNPVRSAMDHGQISAYAAHPYVTDEAVVLVSTTQDFEEIASSLENDGWERDGNVLSTTGDRATLTYTAVAAADGYIALGFSPEGVETAASEDAEPSAAGELAALESLEAPIVGAVVPEGEGTECIELLSFEDFVDETFNFYIKVDGKADESRLAQSFAEDASSVGFEIASDEVQGDTLVLELKGIESAAQLVNSPSIIFTFGLDDEGPLLYDCS